MYIRTSLVCSTLRVSSIRIFILIDPKIQQNTPSTQRKREDTRSIQRKGEDETFQLIQKIHNQLQEVQWDLQRLHSLHKYKN